MNPLSATEKDQKDVGSSVDSDLQTLCDGFKPILYNTDLPAGQSLESLYQTCSRIVSPLIQDSNSTVHEPAVKVAAESAIKAYDDAVQHLKASAHSVALRIRSSILESRNHHTGPATAVFETIQHHWTAWKVNVVRLTSVLLHLSGGLAIANIQRQPLLTVAYQQFKQHVLKDKIIEERYLTCVRKWVDQDRLNHLTNASSSQQSLVTSFIRFLYELDAMETLHSTYLECTNNFYAQLAPRKIPLAPSAESIDEDLAVVADPCQTYGEYIAWASQSLSQEYNRCQDLFSQAGKDHQQRQARPISELEQLKPSSPVDDLWESIRGAVNQQVVEKGVVSVTQQGQSCCFQSSSSGPH